MLIGDKKYLKQRFATGFGGIARFVFFLGMAYILLYPLLMMLSRSIRTQEDLLNASVVWIPSGITFENFKTAMDFLQPHFPVGDDQSLQPTSLWIIMLHILYNLDG